MRASRRGRDQQHEAGEHDQPGTARSEPAPARRGRDPAPAQVQSQRDRDQDRSASDSTWSFRDAVSVGMVQRSVPRSGSLEQDQWDHQVASLSHAPDHDVLRTRWGATLALLASGGPADGRARVAGEAAGLRLWQLARERMQRTAHDPADGERGRAAHFEPLHLMRSDVDAARGRGVAATPGLGGDVLSAAGDAFEQAARGMTSIEWQRPGPGGDQTRRVLLTGFDPFVSGGVPGPRSWNPSGAAVLRLDGSELVVDGQRVAIEGVVYPVSFEQFDRGIVERVVAGQAGAADAIITVSLDNSIGTTAGHNNPVQIEQYAVGMHQRTTITPHASRTEVARTPGEERIPRAPGGGGEAGPVIDAPADVRGIAAASGAVVDTHMDVRFRAEDLERAQRQLGGVIENPIEEPTVLHLTDPVVTAAIARGHHVGPDGSRDTHLTFTAGGETFTAEITGGPGGYFLSNEVAYRTQRQLAASGSSATSFHVHTPGDAPGNEADLGELVETLRSIVRAVMVRRPAHRPGPAERP